MQNRDLVLDLFPLLALNIYEFIEMGLQKQIFNGEIQLKILLNHLTGDGNHLPDVMILPLNAVEKNKYC